MRRALLPMLALARAEAYDVRILVSWDIRGALFPVDGQQDACTAAQLGASPCDCVGGPARRLAALEAARAGGAETLALDGVARCFEALLAVDPPFSTKSELVVQGRSF